MPLESQVSAASIPSGPTSSARGTPRPGTPLTDTPSGPSSRSEASASRRSAARSSSARLALAAESATELPSSSALRLPAVTAENGTSRLSPSRTSIRSGSQPRRSATTWATKVW